MLEVKRSEGKRELFAMGFLAWSAMVALAGCGGGLDIIPTMDEIVDPSRLKYETQNLTRGALEERMRKIDEFYAEPRIFGKVLASYETSITSISEVNGYEALWRGARACAWIAEDEKESASVRKEFALKGMSMGREAAKRASTRPESFYYYAQNIGAYCDVTQYATHDMLHLMRDKMDIARALDEKLDSCGPHRFLGELYIKTDPYPTYALGNLKEGMDHLKRAVELCPEYGENHLVYAKALADDGQPELARAELERVMISPRPKDRSAEHDAWLERASAMLTNLQGK